MGGRSSSPAKTATRSTFPGGVAHGFQSLEDDSEVFYQMSEFYHPDLARGVRYNDPAFAIKWKLPVAVVSERDRGFPDFAD